MVAGSECAAGIEGGVIARAVEPQYRLRMGYLSRQGWWAAQRQRAVLEDTPPVTYACRPKHCAGLDLLSRQHPIARRQLRRSWRQRG